MAAKHKPSVTLLNNLTSDQRQRIRERLLQRAASPKSVPNTIIVAQAGNVRVVFPGAPALAQIRAILDTVPA